MTYNVFGGTLNLAQSCSSSSVVDERLLLLLSICQRLDSHVCRSGPAIFSTRKPSLEVAPTCLADIENNRIFRHAVTCIRRRRTFSPSYDREL